MLMLNDNKTKQVMQYGASELVTGMCQYKEQKTLTAHVKENFWAKSYAGDFRK